MTNLILNLTFVLVTNWTGINAQEQELGYVATNHTLKASYQGDTNTFVLKTTLSDRAVWKPQAVVRAVTNGWAYFYPLGTITNTYVLTNLPMPYVKAKQ